MLVQSVIERLRFGLETKSVFGAAEFFHAQENTGYTNSPTFFVVPNTETAQGADGFNAFDIVNQIRIILMVDLADQDARAERGVFDARRYRAEIFKQVLGWCAGQYYRPATYVNGALIQSDGRRLFYGYTFAFSEQIDPACDGFDATQSAQEPTDIRIFNKGLCK